MPTTSSEKTITVTPRKGIEFYLESIFSKNIEKVEPKCSSIWRWVSSCGFQTPGSPPAHQSPQIVECCSRLISKYVEIFPKNSLYMSFIITQKGTNTADYKRGRKICGQKFLTANLTDLI